MSDYDFATMTLAPGARLGPYEVVAALGAGGMGEVYRAQDARLGREIALKVLPAAFSQDADRVARFERESRAVAALSHPNVLAIYDVGTHEGVAFAAMELLEGETLRDRLERGAVTVRQAIQTGVQIARGLSAAHDKGIVHRDLKPENIFLLRDGQVKILDFGLARAAGDGASAASGATVTALTDVGMVLGTAAYMAPEQVRGETTDARCDLFALGSVLFEMLTGRRAFQRETTAETMTAILNDDAPEIARAGGDVPPSLDRIVRHCLEKNRLERFQTARDVAFALDALSLSATSVGTAAIPAQRRRSLGWTAGVAAVSAVATLAAAAGFQTTRSAATTAADVEFTRRTFDRHVISNARFGPDGRRTFYTVHREGRRPEILELAEGSLAPRVVGAGRLLSVSSKGELAVLLEDVDSTNAESLGTLARMAPEGAPRQVLQSVTAADWAPDGETFAVVRRVDGVDRLECPIGTVLATSNGYLSDIRVSPDGTRLAFLDHPTENDDRGWLKVADMTGAVRALAGEFARARGVAWAADGNRVLFSAATTGTASSVWSVAANSSSSASAPEQVLSVPEHFTIWDSAGAGRLLAQTDNGHLGVGAMLANDAQPRDLSWLDMSWAPSLSRDGSTLVFTDANNGGRGGPTYATVLRKTDGSPVVRLGEGASLGISPDGKWVASALVQSTPPTLVAYPVGAGEPIQFPRGSMSVYYNEMPAVWMPDSQAFLFWAVESGRSPRTYFQSLKGGEPRPVLPEGVRAVLATPDGRQMVGAAADGNWKLYPIDGGAPRPLPSLKATNEFAFRTGSAGDYDYPIGWTDDGHDLLVRSATASNVVERVNITTGARRTVAELTFDGLPVSIVGPAAANGRQYAFFYARNSATLFEVRGAPVSR